MDAKDTPDLPPGTNISGAVVEQRVKAGGYGTVYRARDTHSGTLLAIKFISLQRARERAGREALINMPFRHENLVRQVGFGYWPFAQPRFMWLKMLYVEGRELDVWAWEENPTARAVASKLLGVARGLAVVHHQGIVHRDIKESNILVRDSDGEPVLVDFGAAWQEGQPTLTQGLFPPGTPLYRSPEAWRFGLEDERQPGARYRPAKADDLYALGVVLYRLLTGRYPFEVDMDDPESMKAIIHQAPLPPHISNPRVPESLSAVCLKLLEKKPEDRYPSALTLYDTLKDLLAGADASWEVPLQDGPRAPRRRLRGAAARKKLEPLEQPAPPPVEPRPASSAPASAADLPMQALAFHALRRAAAWMAVLTGLALVGWWLMERPRRPEPPPQPLTSSAPSPTLRWIPGQEVEPSWPPPEIERAAAPPPLEEPTPAVVASKVTRPKDDTVKKQQTPSPKGNKPQKRTLSPMARWCLGATAAASAACTGPGAQVRPAPAPEPCPPGAVETMTDTLGLSIGATHDADFPFIGQPKPVPVREGTTTVKAYGAWGKLPRGSLLHGQLYFGDGRVYGRFTEAQTPTGDIFKVCLEMWQEGKLGAEMEKGSGPDTAWIFSIEKVKAVRRFE
ncbi:MAG TPA: serine/threonine-protein kinase [Myxococcaceae bacterium]|nr:serine/threonine-protein kinase [Myxococcaceae bacterium]